MGLSAGKLQQSEGDRGNMSSGEGRSSSSTSDMPSKKCPVSTSSNFSSNLSKAAVSAASNQLLSRTLSSAGKGSIDLSAYFNFMEQSSMLLKQQQQMAFHHQQQQHQKQSQSTSKNSLTSGASTLPGQKTYEALLADLHKSNDSMTAKMNSPYSSHDAKVNSISFGSINRSMKQKK